MYHYHIAKGSMKDAHNLDDRRDRASVCMREASQVTVVIRTAAYLQALRLF